MYALCIALASDKQKKENSRRKTGKKVMCPVLDVISRALWFKENPSYFLTLLHVQGKNLINFQFPLAL